MFWTKPPIVPPEQIDGVYGFFHEEQTEPACLYLFNHGKVGNADFCRGTYTEGRLKINGDKFKLTFRLVEPRGEGDYNYDVLAKITWKGKVVSADVIHVMQIIDFSDMKPDIGCGTLVRMRDTRQLQMERERRERSERVAAARPVGAADANVEEQLRQAGSKLSVQDIVNTFESVPSTLNFENLDQATRMVFHRVAQEQGDIFRTACPPSALPDNRTLSLEIGKSLFDGYTIGRRLFGTHASRVSFSENEPAAQANGQDMLKGLEHVKPVDLLQAAGEHVADFVDNWAEYHSTQGIYTKIADREGAGTLLLVTMLNGFALAVAEHEVSQ